MGNKAEGFCPVTLITGGSAGIGYSLAEEFAEKGHKLVLVARSKKQLEKAKCQLEKKFNTQVDIISCDLLKDCACREIQDFLHLNRCYVDILVNNAAVGLSGEFTEHESHDVNALIDLNIRSVTNLVHCFLPQMQSRNSGKILNVASTAGLLGLPFHSLYSASKSYLISFSQALAHEVRSQGITVSVLVPGPTDTGFHEKMGVDKALYNTLFPLTPPTVVARIGYNGLMVKKEFIVPGLVNMVGIIGLKFIPHLIFQSVFRRLWTAKLPT